MKIILSIAFILFVTVAFAQDVKKDTAYRFKYNQPVDTTGMGQYGMRLYDTRIYKYMPPDTACKQNPYYFADKKKKYKKTGLIDKKNGGNRCNPLWY